MLQRKTGLARGPGPKRKKGLCAQSRAMRRTKAEQKKAYEAAADAEQCWCSACGVAGPTEHSHLFSQKLWPEYRNDERNWQVLCSACHRCFENHKGQFAQLYPVTWADALQRMQDIDPIAFLASKISFATHPAGAPTTQEGSRRQN